LIEAMKKLFGLLGLLLSLFWLGSSFTQPAQDKLSVVERMAKARATKAQKRATQFVGKGNANAVGIDLNTGRILKATPADYRAPVDKVLKGPHNEVVHVGERGAKYYINKNGNKTYLSSNQ
jgi:colicin import membrane protein